MKATTAREPRIAQPEPGLTAQVLVERARALIPRLREQQAENDRRGHYSDEIHRAFLDGGFYRILQPKLFGGYEFDYPTFIKVILELARGHPATAWCYTLASSHVFLFASHWPEAAQVEIFGDHGDVRVCQRATPAGTITPAEGGYVVDGIFGFASGAPVATHFIGSSMLEAGDGPPQAVSFIAPKESYEVLPDWGGEASLGMQGSGSNSIRLDRVFVPAHHVASADVMMSSLPFNEGTPGTRLHGNPMYIGVAGGAFLTEFGAITTGTARAALEEYERLLDVTPVPRGGGRVRRSDPEAWRVLGKAMNMTDAAEAVTLAAVNAYTEQCDRWARDGTPIRHEDTLKLWGMSQEASQLACRAVDMLFETAGPRASLGGQRLQRYFRDIQMYRVHTTAQPPFATLRAQAHLGQLG
jgi:3-hydroxy-9,10-secoandrosta-1,3,5(10)-triene-9,17-dione monooxygenase